MTELLLGSMSSEHRDAILATAIETFARFGFKRTSIDDIARRAGIGKGSSHELLGALAELHEVLVQGLAPAPPTVTSE